MRFLVLVVSLVVATGCQYQSASPGHNALSPTAESAVHVRLPPFPGPVAGNRTPEPPVQTPLPAAPTLPPADTPEDRLWRAIVHGRVEEAQQLIKAGADVNARIGRSTPLYFACMASWRRQMLDVVKSLVEHGADVNGRAIGGCTPLHEAAGEGSPETVDYLFRAGADVNARDDYGGTPLHWAARRNDAGDGRKIIGSLLAHGADVGAVDQRGRTPIATAKAWDKAWAVTELTDAGPPPPDKPRERK